MALSGPARSTPPVDQKDFIEIKVLNADGTPAAGTRYKLQLSDGKVVEGIVGADGTIRRDGIPKGVCQIWLPDIEDA
jgi:hypothetical protein